jgi:hypothetical protein
LAAHAQVCDPGTYFYDETAYERRLHRFPQNDLLGAQSRLNLFCKSALERFREGVSRAKVDTHPLFVGVVNGEKGFTGFIEEVFSSPTNKQHQEVPQERTQSVF